jgi:hypothetical protein
MSFHFIAHYYYILIAIVILLFQKIKNRFWFVKYIPNQTLFEFHDEEEKFNDFRLELSKIKNIVVGQNCPHVKLR